MHQLATSYYYEGDYAEAVEAQRRTWRGIQMSIQPTGGSQRLQVSWAGQEARAALRKAMELSPQAFEFYTSRRPLWHRPEDYEHMLDGLRKAGWQG